MTGLSKRACFTLADIREAYSGPFGELWEMLMGEEIHVGGERETDILAARTAIARDETVLDICSALGGPARRLVRERGCCVVGLDATPKLVRAAVRRSDAMRRVSFCLGDALELPFRTATFDVVWGQDAWCHVTDTERLIKEAFRVLRPGGRIGFSDWIENGTMADAERTVLNAFMRFPCMETISGYARLLDAAGFVRVEAEDLSAEFLSHCRLYLEKLRSILQEPVSRRYGAAFYRQACMGLEAWVRAAGEGKVGRGRWVAAKPGAAPAARMNRRDP